MKGWGNLWLPTLPFAAAGLIRALVCLREPAYRALLMLTAAAPLGAAAVEMELPRSLVVVVPLTVLTALGLDAVLAPLAARLRPAAVGFGVLALLATINVALLTDALRNGATWYRDYGLYGLQYGGAQVTDAVRDELRRAEPDEQFAISSTWANARNVVVAFFLPEEPRVRVENLGPLLTERYADLERTAFVLTPPELEQVMRSPLFEPVRPFRTVELPDGKPGFQFVRLRYTPRAPALLAAAAAARRRPVTEALRIGGVVPSSPTRPSTAARSATSSTGMRSRS